MPATFFNQLDSIIMQCVWGYKTARISKIHLQKPTYSDEGLALPVFYYWATNARALMFWKLGFSYTSHYKDN